MDNGAQIAVQFAVAMAKIARVDYPRYWPTMMSDMLQKLQGDNVLVVRRAHLVIHHVLKELASKRLASDQAVFAEVCTGISPHVCCVSRHWPTIVMEHQVLLPCD